MYLRAFRFSHYTPIPTIAIDVFVRYNDEDGVLVLVRTREGIGIEMAAASRLDQ